MTEDTQDSGSRTFVERFQPSGRVLSINQIVSYNLMRARRAHAWTQQDVAELLERYTGRSWSNASVSAAERAWQGGRPRKFDASEIVALSKIFSEPIAYFFLPPEEHKDTYVGMKEFPDGRPNIPVPYAADDEFMSLIPVVDLLMNLGISYAPSFVDRMRNQVKQRLGGSWDPPQWGMRLRSVQTLEDLDKPWDDDDPNVHHSKISSPGNTTGVEGMKEQARREIAEELLRGDELGGGEEPWDILRRAADLIEYLQWVKRGGNIRPQSPLEDEAPLNFSGDDEPGE